MPRGPKSSNKTEIQYNKQIQIGKSRSQNSKKKIKRVLPEKNNKNMDTA